MRRSYILILVAVVVVVSAGGIWCYLQAARIDPIEDCQSISRRPRIFPDYTDTVIPANVAPLNFMVLEQAAAYRVRIRSDQGDSIEIAGEAPSIVIPERLWQKLLAANRGKTLWIDVFTQDQDGCWEQFQSISNTIADVEIDSHLVYRLIPPIHHHWWEMRIWQRDLESYDRSTVFDNRSIGNGCVNCHTFLKNSPDMMSLQVRSKYGTPMLIAREDRILNVNTRTGFRPAPAAYHSWHPSGELAAFSVSKLSQFHHSIGESRDVWDQNSDLGVYVVDSNKVSTTAGISDPDRRETWPSWSADGRYLYFASGPQLPMEDHKLVRYDLMRISYNHADSSWGEPETLVSAAETSLSASQPRESPDGRWLLFCLAEYGNFPIFQPSCDIYLMDTQTGEYRRLEINSDRCDSWHCFSSNGRWIAFSSKRRDGLFSKVYFSYFDEDGKAHKPFLLPQKDPAFYDSCIWTFNVPELVTGPVPVTSRQLSRAVVDAAQAVEAEPDVAATSGATPK